MPSRYETPGFSFEEHDIAHYHGDRVRELFLAGAVLSFVALPIWGNLLPFGTFVQVSAGLLLVLLAGLTNPHSKGVLMLDTLFSGLSVLLLESAAISLRATETWPLFIIREVSALLLLIAFYFCVKTLRAMSLGKIGKPGDPNEFTRTL